MLKNMWRFFSYESDGRFYLYDCFSLKLFSIQKELYGLLKQHDGYKIKKNFPEFYKKIIKEKQVKIKQDNDNVCNVTINFSNYCNLDCVYCYRNKKNKNHMDKQEIKNILSFILNDYMPNASGYVFSLCYTSESTLDLEDLIYFDSLIAEFEGHLFNKDDLSFSNAKMIFNALPNEIKHKYEINDETSFIDILNNILKNEKLWLYTDNVNNYLKTILDYTDNVSISHKVKINRDIINNSYPNLKLQRHRPYIVMSFMTNGTLINDKFIDFIKSINMKKIGVSIDGPSEQHNRARYFIGKKDSYESTIQGIKKLMDNGIKVSANTVLQPDYPYPDRIYEALHKLNVDDQVYSLLRSKNSLKTQHFTDIALEKLFDDYDKLIDRIRNNILCNNLDIVYELRNNIIFSTIKFLYFKNFKTQRCSWGKNLVIAADGNVYHCNYSVDNSIDNLGNYKKITQKKIISTGLSVDESKLCRKCWAKYLCGGVCYYEKLQSNQTAIDIECKYKKTMIEKSLALYSWLKKQNCFIDIIEILKND